MFRSGAWHEINLVRLDEQGNLHFADELGATNGDTTKPVRSQYRSTASGVKIVFSDGNGPKQTLYYFSTNLADGSFKRSGFSAFLAKLGPADSFIKSASAFSQAKPNAEYARLYAAAVARRQADQIYNLSLTRTATVVLGQGARRVTGVGRVKTRDLGQPKRTLGGKLALVRNRTSL